MLLWTNVARWAAGRSLALRLPRLGLEFAWARYWLKRIKDKTREVVRGEPRKPR